MASDGLRSRAVNGLRGLGFSPCYLQVLNTAVALPEGEITQVASAFQGLKPNLLLFFTARLKLVP